MTYRVRVGSREFFGVRANLHLHTTESDGTCTHRELAQIAQAAGLDAIVVTDHNVYRYGLDGWVGQTLLLVGEEVHDPQREPQSSHTLCFNIRSDVSRYAADPQTLIDAVADQGGFAFLAHPFERDAPSFLPEPNISWRDWGVTGYAGIELWNYMSEFKSLLKSKAHAILYAYRPQLAGVGPFRETVQKWDELLRSRRLSVLGGSDGHGTVYRMGPLRRAVQPYDYLFRCVNTHLLSLEPLTGDLDHDRGVVYDALREGHGFVCYEQPASAEGFSFWARSGEAEASMGEELPLQRAVELCVTAPAAAHLRILRDGQVTALGQGRELALMAPRAGAYRAEAYRHYAGRQRAWIYSNPIYVVPSRNAPAAG